MRIIESSVTAISWIPREAIQGLPKIPFDLGIGHYDEPPPDQLDEGGLGAPHDKQTACASEPMKAGSRSKTAGGRPWS